MTTTLQKLAGIMMVTTALPAALYAEQPFGGLPRFTRPTPLTIGVVNNNNVASNVSISGDGLSVYWDGDRSRTIDIWMAERTSIDAEWENARPLPTPINSDVRELEPDITSDGLELYFRRSDRVTSGDEWYANDYLMTATRSSIDDPWNEPVRLSDSINDLPCVNHPSVTADGLELYFQASSVVPNADQICRGRDAEVHVSRRENRADEWGEPQLVQAKSAITPGISPDGLQLYYARWSSDSPIPFVRSRDSRDEDFGPPIELGNPPNSGSGFPVWGPELSSEGTLYFSSDRAGTPNFFGSWQSTPAKLCDINGDGSCDVDDLSRRSLFRVDLTEGSDLESDVLKYDISGDGRVDQNDLITWLSKAAESNGIASPYVRGDANLDGIFESTDLVNVFQSGNYELDVIASWSEGDWTGDQRFDSGDMVVAFQDGGYELGARDAVSAVPEPTCGMLLAIGAIVICRLRKR